MRVSVCLCVSVCEKERERVRQRKRLQNENVSLSFQISLIGMLCSAVILLCYLWGVSETVCAFAGVCVRERERVCV